MLDSTTAHTRDTDWSWSSADSPANEALEQTEALCANAIADIRVQASSGQYRLDWLHYGMGPVGLNFIQGTPHRVTRTQLMARQDRNNGFDIVVMQAGSAQVVHGDQVCELPAGAMILLDCNQPWDLMFPSDQHCLSAHMDSAWLHKWLPDPLALTGRAVNAFSPWALPLVSVMRAIATDGLERAPVPRTLLADQLVGLLALAVAAPEEKQLNRHGAELLKRIRTVIRDKFDMADLNAQQVAQEVGISRRHLDKVLAGANTTFLTLLESQRLEAARVRLADRRSTRQIAEIAWSCGFFDPSYFARRFRRSYGASPAQFRRSSLAGNT